MNVKDFYSRIRGDYEGCLSRLMKDERIVKYLRKFADDQEYENLIRALENQDWEQGFLSSHTLKGMCANLGITLLGDCASELCESMRLAPAVDGRKGKAPDYDVSGLIDLLKQYYAETVSAIKELD